MTDALHEFAHLAALALRDITDPDATVHAADEALAALEHHVTALGRESRYAGKLVARCAYKLHCRDYSEPCAALVTLTSLCTVMRWAHMSAAAASLMKAGENLAMARANVDGMPRDQHELRRLLLAVANAVELAAVELAVEMYGRAA